MVGCVSENRLNERNLTMTTTTTCDCCRPVEPAPAPAAGKCTNCAQPATCRPYLNRLTRCAACETLAGDYDH